MQTTKKLTTNSKEVKTAIRQHILECVYDYNTEQNFETFEQAKEYLYSEFKRVANYSYNLKRFPNEQERFSDFMGSAIFWFEFETYKIEEFLNSLGINPEGKKYEANKVWKLYTHLIFKELINK